MTLEATIKDFMHQPVGKIVFTTRNDCLNHLFCVEENCFAWYKGELVGWETLTGSQWWDFNYRHINQAERNLNELDIYNEEVDKLRLWVSATVNFHENYNWSPMTISSYLLYAPRNIKFDWAVGLIETATRILCTFHTIEGKTLVELETIDRNEQIAALALYRMSKRGYNIYGYKTS